MKNIAISWATVALATSVFLSGCGGGGGGGATAAPTNVAGYQATSESVTPIFGNAPSGNAPSGEAPSGNAPTTGTDPFSPTISSLGYPFGSKRAAYVAGVRPTEATQASQDAVIRKQYDYWKSNIQDRCGGKVVLFYGGAVTVSEGAGYGMLLSVLMAGYDSDARDLFDGLFKVVRKFPAFGLNEPALMEWRISDDCTSGGAGGWNAIDGDLDIAMALLMADRQWGSAGSVNYKAEALRTISAIKKYNMNPSGFTAGGGTSDLSRTSDYMITHFKAFKRATGDDFWDLASNKSFELLNYLQDNFAPKTGLIPDFIVNTNSSPIPSPGFRGDGNALEHHYFWNACRLPWRLASDYVTSGDQRSKLVTGKLMDFFNRDTGGDPGKMSAGYALDGTALAPNYQATTFIGPATAGAMVDERFQPFLNKLWSYSSNNLATGYYGTELQLLSMIVTSGNWWNP